MRAYHCGQLSYTIQYSTVLIIFFFILSPDLQTITVALMLSIYHEANTEIYN